MVALTARVADLVSDVLLTSAGVTHVDTLASNIVRVELKSDAFRGAVWVPGSKLQFRPARGAFQMRTYTPTRWDAENGLTEIIGYTHGEGPASGWFRKVSVGDVCEVFGPRHSIDLRDLAGEAVFVGDESSLGLACALRTMHTDAHIILESINPSALIAVLDELGFRRQHCVVVPTEESREALLQAAADAAHSCRAAFDLVVSGDAASVHAIRRGARQWVTKPRKVKGKAYWAQGRTGLE